MHLDIICIVHFKICIHNYFVQTKFISKYFYSVIQITFNDELDIIKCLHGHINANIHNLIQTIHSHTIQHIDTSKQTKLMLQTKKYLGYRFVK